MSKASRKALRRNRKMLKKLGERPLAIDGWIDWVPVEKTGCVHLTLETSDHKEHEFQIPPALIGILVSEGARNCREDGKTKIGLIRSR